MPLSTILPRSAINGSTRRHLIYFGFSQADFPQQLQFRSSGETFYDGGVLEVSSPNINGGAFTDMTNAAVGGSFASGGMGTINASFSNPIGGRQAWSGNSGGYITTVANLGPNVAGQTVKLRWRMGSDTAVSATGWRIDSLTLSDGYICAPVPLSAVSRKTHDGSGTFDVDLPPSVRPGLNAVAAEQVAITR